MSDLILHPVGHDGGVLVVLLDEPLVLVVGLPDLVLQGRDQLVLLLEQRAARPLLPQDLGEQFGRTLPANIMKASYFVRLRIQIFPVKSSPNPMMFKNLTAA